MQNVIAQQHAHHRVVLLNQDDLMLRGKQQANQFLIIQNNQGILLDPAGFGLMPHVLAELLEYIAPDAIQAILVTQLNPAVLNGLSLWLELTQAPIYLPRIWLPYLNLYGLPVSERFRFYPDDKIWKTFQPGVELQVVPAHFLPSPGQISLYDTLSNTLM